MQQDAKSSTNPTWAFDTQGVRDVHMPADITEMWWDVSHNSSIIMEGYRIFRKDRQLGKYVATLCVTDQMKHMELCLRSRR